MDPAHIQHALSGQGIAIDNHEQAIKLAHEHRRVVRTSWLCSVLLDEGSMTVRDALVSGAWPRDLAEMVFRG